MDIRSAPLERRERNLVTIRNSGEKIGSAAAQYFMGQGVARSYAFLHSEGMLDWDLARFKSYRKALKDNGIWCDELAYRLRVGQALVDPHVPVELVRDLLYAAILVGCIRLRLVLEVYYDSHYADAALNGFSRYSTILRPMRSSALGPNRKWNENI